MMMWLDDVRPPWKSGFIGVTWVKTAAEAIACLKTGSVDFASLDHDLAPDHYPWSGVPLEQVSGTGYDVVCWLKDNPQFWPKNGVAIHSLNPVGRARMEVVVHRHYGCVGRCFVSEEGTVQRPVPLAQ